MRRRGVSARTGTSTARCRVEIEIVKTDKADDVVQGRHTGSGDEVELHNSLVHGQHCLINQERRMYENVDRRSRGGGGEGEDEAAELRILIGKRIIIVVPDGRHCTLFGVDVDASPLDW